MSPLPIPILSAAVASLLIVLVAGAALLTRIYVRWGRVVDVPNERSSHRWPVARGGGIVVAGVAVVGTLGIHYLLTGGAPSAGAGALLVAAVGMAAVGFLDDLYTLPVWLRLLAQVVATGFLLANGVVLGEIDLPGGSVVTLGWLAYPLTLVWVVGLTNAYNFMDGLDGLMAGVGAITGAAFALYALAGGASFGLAAGLALAAGLIGFLPYNWPAARVFMGDSGSQFLGFMFAGLAVVERESAAAEHLGPFVILLLLFHVAFDTGATLLRRLLAGEVPTQAHRTHLYQLCQRLGRSHRHVSLTHYGMSLLQALGALWLVAGLGGAERLLVFAPFLVVYGLYARLTWRRARRAGLIS